MSILGGSRKRHTGTDTYAGTPTKRKRQSMNKYESDAKAHPSKGTLSALDQKVASLAFDLNLSSAEYQRCVRFPEVQMCIANGLFTCCCRIVELVQFTLDDQQPSDARSLSVDTLQKLKGKLRREADPCSILVCAIGCSNFIASADSQST